MSHAPGRAEQGPEATLRPFNLVRWFLILGFVCIAATSSTSAYFLSAFLTHNILRTNAAVLTDFVNSVVKAQRAQPVFLGHRSKRRSEELEALFTQVVSHPEVLRANIYGGDRTIIWSSDSEFIGVEFTTNSDLDEAFRGEIVAEQGVVGEVRKAEHAFLKGDGRAFIENYLPVFDNDGGKVIGVVEVYKSPAALLGAIREGRRLVWQIAVLSALILYLTLFWVIKRASTVMEQQQIRLVTNETLAAVGELGSAVAHGLRNPLAAIRSSAELALEDDPPRSLRESLDDIISQSDRLERWVRDLLTGTHPLAPEFQAVRINAIVDDSVAAFSADLERRNIELSLSLDDSLPDIEGSPAALRQAINSVIANAAEAMQSGGKLSISTEMNTRRTMVRILVCDTGTGISRRQMERAFQPFTTSKSAGLGVGLALAKRIVERHSGTLELTRRAGGGTAAIFQLPTTG